MQTLTIDRTKDWTADDYLLLGETTTPCQLINGELIMSPAPTPFHQVVSRNLFRILDKMGSHIGETFYAPIDLYINQKNVFQPDLLFLSNQNRHFVTNRGVEGPPALVVEIISPSNSYTDRYEKKDAYQRFGVKEYWIVDPANKTLEIYATENWNKPQRYLAGDGEVKSSILTDLSFDLSALFVTG